MARGDLSNEQWSVISDLLPPERGRWARPAQDNRRFLNGMLYVLRVGCPWRDMHERYGKWNSVYVRFRRWAEQGVWDALLETLVDLGLTDNWQHMIDSTTVRGHSQAAGAKGGLANRRLAARGAGSPVRFIVSVTPSADRSASTSPAAKRRDRFTGVGVGLFFLFLWLFHSNNLFFIKELSHLLILVLKLIPYRGSE